MASSKETYCLCGQPYNIGQFMIECDCCREWFHGSCVDVKIYHSDDIDKYHCPKCAQTYGPSVLKIPTNNHRADRYELGAETRPSQVGTPAWVRALAARPLRPAPAALQRMSPHQFTEEFIRDNGFTRPVTFTTSEGLDMKTPNPGTFTVRSVLRFCGAQLEVEVIDVRKQSTLRMPLGDFVDYFETPPEHRDEKVLNVLSLEFSETNMSRVVEPPAIARSLDWAERVWTRERPPAPHVRKYCLMSPAGAYTDFHVDFGGTTVWYHVLHGRKIFYLIPPTATNLALYQQWSAANNQNERFFGDMVEWYGTAEVTASQTLFIPSGWIHAVLTPCDSLVFGGNFLHSYAIEMQLQIYEIERRVETPTMFRYPLFEAMHWYAGAHLLTMLRRHNEETQDEEFTLGEAAARAPTAALPALLLRGVKILANALKEWHALKSTDTAKRDNVPKCLNSGQLVRELCKELRTLEKRSTSTTGKDKDFKVKHNSSPTKSQKKGHSNSKKSLKLTLPKPIMHMGQNGEFVDEKVYTDKFFIDNKEVVYQERYVTQDVKFANGLPDTKYVVEGKEMVIPEKGYAYQTYEEVRYPEENGYVERSDKKPTALKIKMNNSPSSSRADAPPPYALPEHSILKSHLIRADRPTLKPIHQWTISKKDIGDYHEEQILFTNENLQANVRIDGQDMNYGPGMYSAEDIQQDYQYSESAKPGSYQPVYSYQQPQQIAYTTVDTYQRYEEVPTVHQQTASYSNVVQEPVNGDYHQTPLPSYDAAIAHQYTATTNYQVVEETKPAQPVTPVRRSERPVRRRVSNTYDYEDSDLYIDDTPAPRPRKTKHKHGYRRGEHSNDSGSSYVMSTSNASNNYKQVSRPAPVNGIESLIQASVLAEEEQPVVETEPEDAAVAGMLSISSRFTDTARTFGLASDTQPRHDKRARKPQLPPDLPDEEDVIKEVHRDDEYVYPSLEMSSDEDEEWTASKRRRNSRNRVDSRSKAEKDEAWSPRARLGRLVPRLRTAARAGVRRECVRAALHAAAARPAPRAPHPAPHHRLHDAQPAPQPNAKRAVLATKSKRPPPPVHNTPNNKNARLKKGMKTAKQRLGKILKIHKMIY
nr:histone lysine demethylase PHF8 isoform X2 [Helicoverpa armigera]